MHMSFSFVTTILMQNSSMTNFSFELQFRYCIVDLQCSLLFTFRGVKSMNLTVIVTRDRSREVCYHTVTVHVYCSKVSPYYDLVFVLRCPKPRPWSYFLMCGNANLHMHVCVTHIKLIQLVTVVRDSQFGFLFSSLIHCYY